MAMLRVGLRLRWDTGRSAVGGYLRRRCFVLSGGGSSVSHEAKSKNSQESEAESENFIWVTTNVSPF